MEKRAQTALALIAAAEAESALIAAGTIEIIEENSRLISERDEWKSKATSAIAELVAIRNAVQLGIDTLPSTK